MVGDIHVSDGIEFEVIWSGGEGLISERPTKVTGIWTPPKRIYNKKSEFWNRNKQMDNGDVVLENDLEMEQSDGQ